VTKYLIVSADGSSGRGSRGMSLYWFLSTYYGWGAVKIVSTKELRENEYSAETVFFGLPSEATKDDLARVRYRHLVIFDYQDAVQVLIDQDREFLRGLTQTYLKVWNEPGWPSEWKWGVLPIRRQARLPLYLKFLKLASLFGAAAPDRVWDVSFLGAATGQELRSQRVEWLREIRGTRGRIKFWGGLVAPPAYREQLTRSGVDNNGLFYDGGRIGFNRFFDLMRKSKAVLTPMGNARWSYRHYEAIYAGAIPVSCDMRHAKVLIPLPLDGMVHVPDGTPALPRIEEALLLPTLTPGVREANVEFLERYLTDGDYARRKPALLESFQAQLPG
jgi:hypothetical protein